MGIQNNSREILNSKMGMFHDHPSESMRDYVSNFGLDADFLDSDLEASEPQRNSYGNTDNIIISDEELGNLL